MDNFDDKYKKRNPFTVPDDYFDGLTDRIMERLEKQEQPRKPKFIQMIRPYIGVAAIFLLALMVVRAILPLAADKEQKLTGDSIRPLARTPETIETDIFDSRFNPTSEEIIEYLAAEMDYYELMYAGIY